MVITRHGEITFKHFTDNPSWAAAAGYDFNFVDCISASAHCTFNISSHLTDDLRDLPNTEVRDLPAFIVKMVIGLLLLSAMTFGYPIFAVAIFIRCKIMKRKYKDDFSETVSHNLSTWVSQVYKRGING